MIIAPYTVAVSGWVSHPDVNAIEEWQNKGIPTETSFKLKVKSVDSATLSDEPSDQYAIDLKALPRVDGGYAAAADVPAWKLVPGNYLIITDLTIRIPRGVCVNVYGNDHTTMLGLSINPTIVEWNNGAQQQVSFIARVYDEIILKNDVFVAQAAFMQHAVPTFYKESDVAQARQLSASGTFI